MDYIETILQLHEHNLQIYELIESTVTCLEQRVFKDLLRFSYLMGGLPTRSVFEVCMQRNTIKVTIGELQYHIKIASVMCRLSHCKCIGTEEMTNAILEELQDCVVNYFIKDANQN